MNHLIVDRPNLKHHIFWMETADLLVRIVGSILGALIVLLIAQRLKTRKLENDHQDTSDFPVVQYNRYSQEDGQRTFTIFGPKKEIDRIIPNAEFIELFGGGCAVGSVHDGQDWKGVRKKRTVAKFKRVLKERGARFHVIEVKNQSPELPPWEVVANHSVLSQITELA